MTAPQTSESSELGSGDDPGVADVSGSVQRARDLFSSDEIAQLIRPSRVQGLVLVGHCWLMILGIWTLCVVFPHPLLWLVAIPLIGARQLGLAILNHDGAHYTLHPNKKLNDWVSEWLLNRPLFGDSVIGYRKYHLVHHRFTQQENDPDLHLSAKFPITRASLRRKIWRDLSGQTGLKQYGNLVRSALSKGRIAHSSSGPNDVSTQVTGFWQRLGPNLVINALFLAGFAAAGAWYLYFVLWVLPAFTWERFITRLRNIGEHAVVPDNDDRLRNTRTVVASWWERACIAPYFVNYHLEHHLLVSCPCYRLPQAHAALIHKGYGPRMEVQRGYRRVLELATSVPEPTAA